MNCSSFTTAPGDTRFLRERPDPSFMLTPDPTTCQPVTSQIPLSQQYCGAPGNQLYYQNASVPPPSVQRLPALGFICDRSDQEWSTFYAAGGDRPQAFFGLTGDPEHHPNGTRIAFWAESRADVDQIAELLRQIDGRNLEGPELCREYSPGYYAVFFEDPDGNKLEVCSREQPVIG